MQAQPAASVAEEPLYPHAQIEARLRDAVEALRGQRHLLNCMTGEDYQEWLQTVGYLPAQAYPVSDGRACEAILTPQEQSCSALQLVAAVHSSEAAVRTCQLAGHTTAKRMLSMSTLH